MFSIHWDSGLSISCTRHNLLPWHHKDCCWHVQHCLLLWKLCSLASDCPLVSWDFASLYYSYLSNFQSHPVSASTPSWGKISELSLLRCSLFWSRALVNCLVNFVMFVEHLFYIKTYYNVKVHRWFTSTMMAQSSSLVILVSKAVVNTGRFPCVWGKEGRESVFLSNVTTNLSVWLEYFCQYLKSC